MTAKCCECGSETLEQARVRLGINYSELGRRLAAIVGREIAPSTTRRWCMPGADPESRRPRVSEDYRAVFLVTGGTVTPNSFHDMDAWRADLQRAESGAT